MLQAPNTCENRYIRQMMPPIQNVSYVANILEISTKPTALCSPSSLSSSSGAGEYNGVGFMEISEIFVTRDKFIDGVAPWHIEY